MESVQNRKINIDINTYIYGIWKNGSDGLICRAAIETQGFPGGASGKEP